MGELPPVRTESLSQNTQEIDKERRDVIVLTRRSAIRNENELSAEQHRSAQENAEPAQSQWNVLKTNKCLSKHKDKKTIQRAQDNEGSLYKLQKFLKNNVQEDIQCLAVDKFYQIIQSGEHTADQKITFMMDLMKQDDISPPVKEFIQDKLLNDILINERNADHVKLFFTEDLPEAFQDKASDIVINNIIADISDNKKRMDFMTVDFPATVQKAAVETYYGKIKNNSKTRYMSQLAKNPNVSQYIRDFAKSELLDTMIPNTALNKIRNLYPLLTHRFINPNMASTCDEIQQAAAAESSAQTEQETH